MSGTTELVAESGGRVRPTDRGPARDYFRADVEGLRTVAVVGVVAYHAGLPLISGGFVGVDVFFVISGFLITGLLVREHTRTRRISFRAFYARRARRIVPAAATVLVATAIAAFVFQPTLEAYNTSRSVLAAAFFLANWHFIGIGTDYFGGSTADSPVLHYWSLAVEEQFYLAWPALLVIGYLVARRLRLPSRGVLLVGLGLVALVSLGWSVLQTGSDPTAAYMSTFTRGWEFGLGGLLALGMPALEARSLEPGIARLGAAAGWAGLALVAISLLTYTETMPFPGAIALLPTVGTALIIGGGSIRGSSGPTIGRLLALPPVRFVGRVSFGWYLWHWPMLIIAEDVFGPLRIREKAVIMGLAFVAAVVTFYLIERPIARWRELGRRPAPSMALGMLSISLATIVSLLVGTSAVGRLSSADATANVDLATVFGPDTGVHAGPVNPNPLDAGKDMPTPDGCLLNEETDRVASCRIGVPGGEPVVLFGDSHAHQWIPAIEAIAQERSWDVTVFARAGCPVNDIAPRPDDSRFSQPWCTDWRQQAIDQIVSLHPQVVIVSSLHTYLPDQTETLQTWEKSLDRLRGAGAPIVYLRDTPNPENDVPTCISGAFDDWDRCAFPFDGVPEPVVPEVAAGKIPDVAVVDMLPYFCDGATCAAVRNGLLLYRDDSHISATAATALAPALEQALVDQKAIPPRAG